MGINNMVGALGHFSRPGGTWGRGKRSLALKCRAVIGLSLRADRGALSFPSPVRGDIFVACNPKIICSSSVRSGIFGSWPAPMHKSLNPPRIDPPNMPSPRGFLFLCGAGLQICRACGAGMPRSVVPRLLSGYPPGRTGRGRKGGQCHSILLDRFSLKALSSWLTISVHRRSFGCGGGRAGSAAERLIGP